MKISCGCLQGEPCSCGTTCGCCEGTASYTPFAGENPPGLDSLAYRTGVHGAFLETMKARLSSLELDDGNRPLDGLTTREANDPAIALLDAAAVLCDVLAFYDERIANEGYLRTATERRSVLELGRLVGTGPRPGVAATCFLAFSLDSGQAVTIPAGTRAQSMPGPDELPQFFETGADLPGRFEWNAIRPRLTRPLGLTLGSANSIDGLVLDGIATNLAANNLILLGFAGGTVVRQVTSVIPDNAALTTAVTLRKIPFSAVVEFVSAGLARAVDPEANKVSPGVASRRVLAGFERLKERLKGVGNPAEARAALHEGRTTFQREHAIAVEKGYTRLEPWLASLAVITADYEAAMAGAEMAEPGVASSISTCGDIDFIPNALDLMVVDLSPAPHKQPANALALDRGAREALDPSLDLIPKMITTVNPHLADSYYAAWANAAPDVPLELLSVTTPRVNAPLFGHIALPQPITNDEGVVIASREWPLSVGELELGLSPGPDPEDPARIKITMDLTFGADTFQKQFETEASEEGNPQSVNWEIDQVQFGTVEIQYSAVIGIERIIFNFPNRRIVMVSNSSSIGLSAGLPNPEFSYNGQVIGLNNRVNVGGRRVTLSSTQGVLSLVEGPPLEEPNVVVLDNNYPLIQAGDKVVIQRPGLGDLIRQVVRVSTLSRLAYGLTGRVTALVLDENWLFLPDEDFDIIRGTTVHAQTEELTPAEVPVSTDLAGNEIELGTLFDGLEAGRWLIVEGERSDITGSSGVRAAELVMLTGVRRYEATLPGDLNHSLLVLAEPLAYSYKRETVTIYGNVAKSSHGESRVEVLGSGDGALANQSFILKSKPLTHVAESSPDGVASTLAVRVDGILWHETPNLVRAGSEDRVFATQTADDGTVAITFGDGKHGTRLPGGIENVTANARVGIGKLGNVVAGQASVLATRPLGVAEVINPLRASGGAEPDGRDAARERTPLATAALDRLVSVSDYGDFARTWAGIGKAHATRLTDGYRQVVHLTIAGVDDIPIDSSSDLFNMLAAALNEYGDPCLPVVPATRKALLIVVAARIRVHPDHSWEIVEAALRARLLADFGFARRALGENLVPSCLVATMAAVAGVVGVDLDLVDLISEDTINQPSQAERRLVALIKAGGKAGKAGAAAWPKQVPVALARRLGPGCIAPAEIAYLHAEIPDTLILQEVSS